LRHFLFLLSLSFYKWHFLKEKMTDAFYITIIVDITVLLIVIILLSIYLLTIIFVRRFHNTANILTGNVCLNGIICSLFWTVYGILSGFYQTLLAQSGLWCFVNYISKQTIFQKKSLVFCFVSCAMDGYHHFIYT
jgi:hypothetical protein